MTDLVATGGCVSCGDAFTFCPECVTVMIIDPVTLRPPDVDANNRHRPTIRAVLDRCKAYPLCVPCTVKANKVRPANNQIETELARHARHVGHPIIRATA